MTDLKDIQELARVTIAADAYFAAALVVADVGLSNADIESALTNRGFAVIIDVPVDARSVYTTSGSIECYVTLPVHVQINPRENAKEGGAQVVITEAVEKVFAALLGYDTGEEADRFEADGDLFQLVAQSEGLWAYVLWFRKMVNLS